MSSLSEQTRVEIIDRLNQGESAEDLAKEYKLAYSAVYSLPDQENRLNKRASERCEYRIGVEKVPLAKKLHAIARIKTGDKLAEVASDIGVNYRALIKWYKDEKRLIAIAASCGIDFSMPEGAYISYHDAKSFETRLKAIKRIERGESIKKVAKQFNVVERTIRKWFANKRKIKNQARNKGVTLNEESSEEEDEKNDLSGESGSEQGEMWQNSSDQQLADNEDEVSEVYNLSALQTLSQPPAKRAYDDDMTISAPFDPSDLGMEEEIIQAEQESNRPRAWLRHYTTQHPCECSRCIYTKLAQQTSQVQNEYKCNMVKEGELGVCHELFSSQESLLLHQLDVHHHIYPLNNRVLLNLHQTTQKHRSAPPPTVYLFQQYDNPMLPPKRDIDPIKELHRIKKRTDGLQHLQPLTLQRRKKRVYRFIRDCPWEFYMYDVFMEACSRWQWGDEHEQQAQYQEAYEFYAQSVVTKFHVPSNAPNFSLVGQGRNWLTPK